MRTIAVLMASPIDAAISLCTQRDIAASIGEAIRTAIVLTGRTPSLLSDFELLIDDGVLELKANAALEDMLTPQLIYRFEKLAKRLGLKSKLAKRD